MKKDEAQKRLKRNKGRHRKIHKKCPLYGGKQFFLAKAKTRKQKTNKQKNKTKQKKQKTSNEIRRV